MLLTKCYRARSWRLASWCLLLLIAVATRLSTGSTSSSNLFTVLESPQRSDAVLRGSNYTVGCSIQFFVNSSVFGVLQWNFQQLGTSTDDAKRVKESKIISSYNTKTGEYSASLFIANADLGDEGNYSCAFYGINKYREIGKALLRVKYAPIVSVTSESTVYVPVGTKFSSTCHAQSWPIPSVQWRHHRHNLTALEHFNMASSRDKKPFLIDGNTFSRDVASVNVSTSTVRAGEEGQYTCVATNNVGTTRKHVQVIIQYVPNVPDTPSSVTTTQTSLDLVWTVPHNGNSAILSYDLEVKPRGGASPYSRSVPGNVTQRYVVFTVNNLEPWSRYSFRVRAQNAIGYSNFSDATMDIYTLPLVPSAVNHIEVVKSGPTFVQLQIHAPSSWVAGMGRLDNYVVKYRALTGGETTKVELPVNVSENITSLLTDWTLDQLEKGTNYSIAVESNNGKFQATAVQIVAATTATVPGNASFLAASAISHEAINVSWGSFTDDGGRPISHLLLSYKVDEGEEDDNTTAGDPIWVVFKSDTAIKPDENAAVVEGLQKETPYVFQLVAVNAVGEGIPALSSIVMTPKYQHPPKVDFLEAAETLVSSAMLRWRLAEDRPLVPLSHLQLEYRALGLNDWTVVRINNTDVRQFNVTGLAKATKFKAQLKIFNKFSSTVRTLRFDTGNGKPSKIADLTLARIGSTFVIVSWTRTSTDRYPPTALKVFIYRADTNHLEREERKSISAVTSGSFTISGLHPGKSYYFIVVASNQYGDSQQLIKSDIETLTRTPTTSPISATTDEGAEKDKSSGGGGGNNTILIIAASAGIVVVVVIVVVAVSVKNHRQQGKSETWKVPATRGDSSTTSWQNTIQSSGGPDNRSRGNPLWLNTWEQGNVNNLRDNGNPVATHTELAEPDLGGGHEEFRSFQLQSPTSPKPLPDGSQTPV